MKQTMPVTYPVMPQVLLRAFTDRAFHEAKIQALGALSSEVLEQSVNGDVFMIRVRRSMCNETPVPALLKKLITAVSMLEHVDHWNTKTGKGQVALSIEGVPVELTCKLKAIACGMGTELRHDWDVRCKLPMVAGAIERFIAADLPRLMEQEAKAGLHLLARYA